MPRGKTLRNQPEAYLSDTLTVLTLRPAEVEWVSFNFSNTSLRLGYVKDKIGHGQIRRTDMYGKCTHVSRFENLHGFRQFLARIKVSGQCGTLHLSSWIYLHCTSLSK